MASRAIPAGPPVQPQCGLVQHVSVCSQRLTMATACIARTWLADEFVTQCLGAGREPRTGWDVLHVPSLRGGRW